MPLERLDKTVHETFMRVANASTREDKILELRKRGHVAIKLILQYAYNPNVVWKLPEGGAPPYKALENDHEGPGLLAEARRLYVFVAGPLPAQKNLKPLRREQLFVGMLEGIDPRDAKVLIAIKDRDLSTLFDGLTRSLVAEAFPDISHDWGDVSEKPAVEEKTPVVVAKKAAAKKKSPAKKVQGKRTVAKKTKKKAASKKKS